MKKNTLGFLLLFLGSVPILCLVAIMNYKTNYFMDFYKDLIYWRYEDQDENQIERLVDRNGIANIIKYYGGGLIFL